jgi:hypothetical protein
MSGSTSKQPDNNANLNAGGATGRNRSASLAPLGSDADRIPAGFTPQQYVPVLPDLPNEHYRYHVTEGHYGQDAFTATYAHDPVPSEFFPDNFNRGGRPVTDAQVEELDKTIPWDEMIDFSGGTDPYVWVCPKHPLGCQCKEPKGKEKAVDDDPTELPEECNIFSLSPIDDKTYYSRFEDYGRLYPDIPQATVNDQTAEQNYYPGGDDGTTWFCLEHWYECDCTGPEIEERAVDGNASSDMDKPFHFTSPEFTGKGKLSDAQMVEQMDFSEPVEENAFWICPDHPDFFACKCKPPNSKEKTMNENATQSTGKNLKAKGKTAGASASKSIGNNGKGKKETAGTTATHSLGNEPLPSTSENEPVHYYDSIDPNYWLCPEHFCGCDCTPPKGSTQWHQRQLAESSSSQKD